MTHSEINGILTSGYNQSVWKGFLKNLFPGTRFSISPDILENPNFIHIATALRLGHIVIDENGINREIGIFEVKVDDGVVLERNRVGLRNLLRKYWKNLDGAFVVYFQQSTSIWRFTYVSELRGFNDSGEYINIKTDPKRYTYIFGEGESCKTAVERFLFLKTKGSKVSIDDIIEAFSVEKLSKSFFDSYKKIYEEFCNYLTNKRSIFQPIFNGDEKELRDFTKLLLGRITFIYFIQKKGWLGVQPEGKWGEGDTQFLWNLYQKSRPKSLFYKNVLTRLFFDSLNNPRENDLIELTEGKLIKIPFLNGGLFEEENVKYREIVFDEQLFDKLFAFFNQYNFTIYEDDPTEHTVAVDPEMLGHIFENLLEDNKDKGAYYTPKEIVHYMCQESLIEYLTTWFENKEYKVIDNPSFDDLKRTAIFTGKNYPMESELPADDIQKIIFMKLIEKLIKKTLDQSDQILIKPFISELNLALDSVKICDPAIGSGAFPMGLLLEIFSAKQTLWFFKHKNLNHFPASEIKLNIIQNSIYGVDIEKGAVDIARLRFWLTLVVDEVEPKALPNLDYKIVVGNSLVSKLGEDIIDIDWNVNKANLEIFENDLYDRKIELINKISLEQKKFFYSDASKKKFASVIRNLKIDLLITQLELLKATKWSGKKLEVSRKKLSAQTMLYLQTQGWDNNIKQLKYLKDHPEEPLHFFDWNLDFPEILNESINSNPGFDIVIANPPYIKEYTNRDAFNGFRESSYYQGKMDIWYGFACKMLDFLKPNGIECYIAQNNWITSSGASILRKKVTTETKIKLFTDFGNYKVFETAGIQTMIYLLRHVQPSTEYEIKYSVLRNDKINKVELGEFLNFNYRDNNSEKFILNFSTPEIEGQPFTFNSSIFTGVLEKIKSKGSLYLYENEVAQGIVFPQDFVNKKSAEKLKNSVGVGDGIFALTQKELNDLGINSTEKKIIKAYYTTEELSRYYANPKNKLWIIYTGSEFKNPKSIQQYPNIKRHLDRFKDVITSDNRPYGLHRARDERFFIGESIIAQRKCPNRPSFTYTDFNCYVSATFYILKTTRLNMKYLTALLNSKLIAYWLRKKGKMQGTNFQIDKEPILAVPLIKPSEQIAFLFEKLVNKIFHCKSECEDTTKIEEQIDNLVYRLYDLTYDEVKVIDPEFPLTEEEYQGIVFE